MFDNDDDSGFDLFFVLLFIGPMLFWWFIQANIALLCFVFELCATAIQLIYYAIRAIIDFFCKIGKQVLLKE